MLGPPTISPRHSKHKVAWPDRVVAVQPCGVSKHSSRLRNYSFPKLGVLLGGFL